MRQAMSRYQDFVDRIYRFEELRGRYLSTTPRSVIVGCSTREVRKRTLPSNSKGYTAEN